MGKIKRSGSGIKEECKMTYFFVLFACLGAVSDCLAFSGLPMRTSLIASKADFSYRTARVIGSIPAFWSLFKTLSGFILRKFAISSRVYPSIFIISEYSRIFLENILKFRIFYLDMYPLFRILFSIGNKKPCRPGVRSSPTKALWANGRLIIGWLPVNRGTG